MRCLSRSTPLVDSRSCRTALFIIAQPWARLPTIECRGAWILLVAGVRQRNGGGRMPAFLYVRSRNALQLLPARRAQLEKLARRLAPDNIAYRPPIVVERG